MQGVTFPNTLRPGRPYAGSMAERTDQATGSPIVDLTGSSIDDDVRTTTIRISGPLPAAVAPATLMDPATRKPVLELHSVTRADGAEVMFETYGGSDDPPVGSYVLQSWWVPDALALVLDRSRSWTLADYPSGAPDEYPDDGPDFCLLTYQSFQPGDPAYTDKQGAWISIEAHERFIAGDLLRVRTPQRSVG